MLRDGAGRSFSTPEALTRLAGTSAAPIYGSDTLVGYGVVGGRSIVFEAQAALAADLAMRVLAGEPAGSIAPLTTSANRDLYDWQVKRWGLRERDLPPGAVMLNRVPPLWEIYRWHITATVGLIAGQAGLIGALLLHRRRRRRAEIALQERLDFETFVLDLSAGFVDQHGPGVDTAIERGCQRVTKYFGLDGAMVMELIAGEDAMRVTHAWIHVHAAGQVGGGVADDGLSVVGATVHQHAFGPVRRLEVAAAVLGQDAVVEDRVVVATDSDRTEEVQVLTGVGVAALYSTSP